MFSFVISVLLFSLQAQTQEETTGNQKAGFIIAENGAKIELLLPAATRQTIVKDSIAKREMQDRSPMPEGLIATSDDLRDLLAYFLNRLNQYRDNEGSVLDNTIVLYGSGASTTHRNVNLPTLIVGGGNMGLKHGHYERGCGQMTSMFLSVLHSMGIEEESFGDSGGALSNSIFRR